ncbi:response regulator transcription factor [Sulfuricurvum sp.]|uniref:response regulator transcription factor n=1 Tax=Sulfuricurvum sp. TaxID=2025608 RepID=UPI00262821B1|nr:response regulator transcription factor [Sulfuricurvum sp.]MDD2781804.1 response regulator transcription factor [Sulfuricurvum sp.]
MMNVAMYSVMDSVLNHWKKSLGTQYQCVTYKNDAQLLKALVKKDSVQILLIDETHVHDIISFLSDLRKIYNGKVFLFNAIPNVYHAYRLITLKIDGYENIYIAGENLHKAIDTIQNGMCWFFDELAYFIIKRHIQQNKLDEPDFMQFLTDKEKEIAIMVANGLTNKEIAARHKNALSTVKNHIKNIFDKAGVNNRVSLTLKFQ